MDFFHGFGIRDDEIVVASVVLLAAEMFGSEVLDLQAGSHRAIEDEDFLFEGVEVTAVGVFSLKVLIYKLLRSTYVYQEPVSSNSACSHLVRFEIAFHTFKSRSVYHQQ